MCFNLQLDAFNLAESILKQHKINNFKLEGLYFIFYLKIRYKKTQLRFP